MVAPTDINLHKSCMALSQFKCELLGKPLRFQASDLQAILRMQRDLRDLRQVMVRLAIGKDLTEAGVDEYLAAHSDEWINEAPPKERPDATTIAEFDSERPVRLGVSRASGPAKGNRFSVYLGSQIINWRRRLGIPREEIRGRTKIGGLTLEKIEAGFNQCPRWATIVAITEAMGAVAIIELVEQDEFERRFEALRETMHPTASFVESVIAEVEATS